ncbi:MAG: PD-(D/E)XK nuclease family protein [Candidatus Diapherotrites archaeon]|nr:PD-(D/E)XK nuclease family protein [Candidatus Diapherotrites archaeon]
MPTWSHSRISTYENCPLKFYYTYVEKPDVEEVLGDNIALVLGKSCHEALEWLYKELSFGREPSLDDAIDYYTQSWGKMWTPDVIIPRFDEKTWKKLGIRYLGDFYNRHSPFIEDRTVALERMVRLKIGKYSLIGYIDRVAEASPGHYKIIDYKTTKRLQGQDWFDSDRQLALYEIGLRQMFRDVEEVDLVWHMLHFNKEIVSRRTPGQLEQLKSDTIELISTIEAAEEYPAKVCGLCPWCSFQEICPKKKHERATTRMTVREFRRDEGVRVANKFVQTKLKLDEWGIKNADARKDVLAYSKQHDTSKVIGSKAAVAVSTMKRVSFDPKVEKLLKKEGLWEKYSKLDSAALVRELEGLDPKIRGKLVKLEETKESKAVRVVKK